MFVLLCVARIRCSPINSDHRIDTHICGTLSASLRTLHILTVSYPRWTVCRIRAVLYVLSSHTWFGSIQALVTKEESSRIISRPLSFTVFLMDRTLLATYCERVNSVAWRYPSYSIWRLGRCCSAFYCGAKRWLCARYNVLFLRCGFVFFDRDFFSENLWKIFVGQTLRTPVSVTVRNWQWQSSSRFFCILNMTQCVCKGTAYWITLNVSSLCYDSLINKNIDRYSAYISLYRSLGRAV